MPRKHNTALVLYYVAIVYQREWEVGYAFSQIIVREGTSMFLNFKKSSRTPSSK